MLFKGMDDAELKYLYGLERFGTKMGLEVMRRLMDITGHPEKKWPGIHIIGTNGKGSTASFLDAALRSAGLKSGLYTSPHIYSFNERVRVDGREISDQRLTRQTRILRRLIEKHDIKPTFFEFTTALAFMEFAEQEVDIAVVEVGLGGPLDATNIITPLLTVITNIGLDHMDILGITTAAIAKQEAEVIKPNVPVITAEEDVNILRLFEEKCLAMNSSLHTVQDNVTFRPLKSNFENQTFSVEKPYKGQITIPLLGHHQITNACTALLALRVLNAQGFNLPFESIKKGLANNNWEGRLDIVSKEPLIIVDGAHNNDGVKVLAKWLKNIKRYDVLVLGSKKDNDLSVMINDIVPLFSEVIVTKSNYMPEDTAVIAEQIKQTGKSVREIPDINKALEAGQKMLFPGSTMLITGSLYMIGDALAILRKQR